MLTSMNPEKSRSAAEVKKLARKISKLELTNMLE